MKVVIIRHAEKPAKGDNLNCQGLNRSRLLPNVMVSKFGIPSFCYVPSLSADSATKHARMFQTITPLAAQYNLTVNSKFAGADSAALAADILKRTGTVLVVWDHKKILPIVHALGIAGENLYWSDDDFDSIWIITFNKGKAVFSKDAEGLHPLPGCN
ncbi:MAG: histidine phosphatase family protein [Bacteroidetes bacterium]|nr:histidine phosphatase family protein [Bacteroidota bacterium]